MITSLAVEADPLNIVVDSAYEAVVAYDELTEVLFKACDAVTACDDVKAYDVRWEGDSCCI